MPVGGGVKNITNILRDMRKHTTTKKWNTIKKECSKVLPHKKGKMKVDQIYQKGEKGGDRKREQGVKKIRGDPIQNNSNARKREQRKLKARDYR